MRPARSRSTGGRNAARAVRQNGLAGKRSRHLLAVDGNQARCGVGAPALAVLTFEVLLNATSMINDSNVAYSLSFDRVLHWFLVTPDMHRVLHSILSRQPTATSGSICLGGRSRARSGRLIGISC